MYISLRDVVKKFKITEQWTFLIILKIFSILFSYFAMKQHSKAITLKLSAMLSLKPCSVTLVDGNTKSST